MSDIAIRVENLGKQYKLGGQKSGSFRESLSRIFRRPETGNRKPENTGRLPDSGLPTPDSDFWALQDINFEIKRGEAVGIIGRNGAGKSTLLKILSRITEPTTGRYEIFGRVSSLLEVGTGFHPELTGRENVYLNGTILGMKRREVKAKFDEIVAFSGVEKFIDTPVKHYSSGMQVRLAFAVAAHLEPEILIIDEVLAVGDAEFQKKCLGKMEDVTGEGRTVLFVSHNMGAIEKLCQKSIFLHQGKVADYNKTRDIIESYLKSAKSKHNGRIQQVTINNELKLQNIKTEYKVSRSLEFLYLSFSVVNSQYNKINGIALLFYDYKGERVSILDLRSEKLINDSKQNLSIAVEAKFSIDSFLPGKYTIGLYLDSVYYSGNIEEVSFFNVEERNFDFIPYPNSVRGSFRLQSY